jgi:type II secretory pathway component PulM
MMTLTALIRRLANFANARLLTLAARERKIAVVLLALLLAGLLYGLLIKPAWNYSQRANLTLLKEQSTWTLIQAHAERIRQMNAARQQKTGDDTSLFALASKTAIEHEITLSRYEISTDGKLSLWITAAQFNTLLAWLDQLANQYNIQIEHATVGAAAQPGVVDAQLLLRQQFR